MLWLLASLMMTPTEEAQVAPMLHEAHDALPARVSTSPNDDIHLSGLVYTSPHEWVVWLNGIKMRPDSLNGEGFRIQGVDAKHVTLALNNHPGEAFTLSPGEHLSYSNGQIADASYNHESPTKDSIITASEHSNSANG